MSDGNVIQLASQQGPAGAIGATGATGPQGPQGVAGVTTATDEADASLIAGLGDGQPVFILSHRSIWISDPNDTRPIVTGPTSPDNNQRIERNGGGTLNRTPYVDPNWLNGITDIYIDPNNSTGIASNENRGIFYAPQTGNDRAPLLTWAELHRRIGSMQRMTTGDLVNRRVIIHVLSDYASNNSIDICELQLYGGVQTHVTLQGEASTVYVNTTLDVSGGYTALSATGPLGGQAPEIKVTGQVWAPYVGFMLYFPATGAVATVLKDLGSGRARISQPVITNKETDQLLPTAVNPSNGDAVQIKLWCGINPGSWKWRFAGTTNDSPGMFKIQNLVISIVGQSALWAPQVETGSAYSRIQFYEVRTDRVILHNDNVVWSGCQIRGGYQAAHGEFGGGVVGCGIVPQDGRPHIYITGRNSHALNRGVFDFDTALQDCFLLVMGPTQIGSISVWDAPVSGNNPAGHGICVGLSQNQCVPAHLAITGGTIFGSGQAGRGIHVNPGSHVTYELIPNITGTAGDFGLGNGATGWYFDGTTNPPNYQPQNGIACSWANLAAANPGGFNHQAHDPRTNAHICKVTAF